MARATLPYHIDTYRGMIDGDGRCRLAGRVLARPPGREPRADDGWWDNLRNSYQRFDAEHLAGVDVDVAFRGRRVSARTDAEGYYEAEIPLARHAPGAQLWEVAEVRRSEGGPAFLQFVLSVPAKARFGLISDIDDTVLQSNVSHLTQAFQTTFLRNARTRKPLQGVGALYQAFHRGRDGAGPNPVFYVSASPWNVYPLLVDFMALNDLPDGPIELRDVDFDRASLLHNAGPRSKLSRIHDLIGRFPALQWVLVGDSGQIDAELYAQTVEKFPGRVLAVYIRDIDPGKDSAKDRFVDSHIRRIAGSGVPMLRVGDGNAIAAHARQLGLIEAEEVPAVAKDVVRDQVRPSLAQAAAPAQTQAAGGEPPAASAH